MSDGRPPRHPCLNAHRQHLPQSCFSTYHITTPCSRSSCQHKWSSSLGNLSIAQSQHRVWEGWDKRGSGDTCDGLLRSPLGAACTPACVPSQARRRCFASLRAQLRVPARRPQPRASGHHGRLRVAFRGLTRPRARAFPHARRQARWAFATSRPEGGQQQTRCFASRAPVGDGSQVALQAEPQRPLHRACTRTPQPGRTSAALANDVYSFSICEARRTLLHPPLHSPASRAQVRRP